MRISQYIKVLKKIMEEHGDLPVEKYGFSGRHDALPPEIAYRKILTGRQSKPDFWSKHSDPIGAMGDTVCKI